ncbi:hypothetical protein NDK43_06815 [Neobacillus pocheonensis]|uniref:Uncharacterized protein n=1 Tax=Neobacillus pocheonensis TaxID=363869 RepID=A0ABT0W759_9BACI|nr:hypothetical protein [Neobacillus pocheonensis]
MDPYDFYIHPNYIYNRNAYYPYFHPSYPYYCTGYSYYSPEYNSTVYNRYPVLNDPPDVSGNWETYFGSGPTKSIMNLTQQGNTVTGTYEFDSKKGQIQGLLSGYTLRGEWSQTPSYQYPNDRGQLIFDFTPQVHQPFDFTGYWSYGTNEPQRTPEFLWKGHKFGFILGVPMPEFGTMPR